jgi:hypothetical protein
VNTKPENLRRMILDAQWNRTYVPIESMAQPSSDTPLSDLLDPEATEMIRRAIEEEMTLKGPPIDDTRPKGTPRIVKVPRNK